jgi:hypothetical protein
MILITTFGVSPRTRCAKKRNTDNIYIVSTKTDEEHQPKTKITDVIPYKERDFSTSRGSYN